MPSSRLNPFFLEFLGALGHKTAVIPVNGHGRKLIMNVQAMGTDSLYTGVELPTTLIGGPSLRAEQTGARLWMPMSPSPPLPKSHQPRQRNGT